MVFIAGGSEVRVSRNVFLSYNINIHLNTLASV